MAVIMKAWGFANGAPCPFVGQYLKTFDFEAHNGRGHGTFTSDRDEAMRFADIGSAMNYWKTQSITRPIRPDGKPNRPLTSTHVEMEYVE